MAGRPSTKGYAAVDDEETVCMSEAESCEDLLNGGEKRPIRPSAWIPRVYCNAAGFLALAASTILIVLATIRGTLWYLREGSNAPAGWIPAFSPVYDMMDLRRITTYADNSPAPNASDPRHIYRLPPSPEVDAAWDRIAAADGIFPMSASDVVRVGKDPAFAVDAPASWNFPPGKSKMMGIEGLHQLHCLNAVRKGIITNYDYYWGSKYGFAPPAVFTRHLNHCIDMLRQHLMCHPDLEPFTFNWRKGQFKPYADFNIQKKCVDFEYMLEWTERHKDPRHTELWMELKKPANALQKEAPPDLPQITNETVWSEKGVALATLAGLEGKQYCLGA